MREKLALGKEVVESGLHPLIRAVERYGAKGSRAAIFLAAAAKELHRKGINVTFEIRTGDEELGILDGVVDGLLEYTKTTGYNRNKQDKKSSDTFLLNGALARVMATHLKGKLKPNTPINWLLFPNTEDNNKLRRSIVNPDDALKIKINEVPSEIAIAYNLGLKHVMKYGFDTVGKATPEALRLADPIYTLWRGLRPDFIRVLFGEVHQQMKVGVEESNLTQNIEQEPIL